MDALSELQDWYLAQCNGDWEHEFGISISTLDNPGWHLMIQLGYSLLEDQSFAAVRYGNPNIRIDSQSNELPETPVFGNWVECSVKDNVFHGSGGALKLGEIIGIFLKWAHEIEIAESTPEAEKRREQREKEKSDRLFWDVLGNEVWERNCAIEGRSNKCTRFSAWCRHHHFKRSRGYKYPFEDEAKPANRVLEYQSFPTPQML